MTLYLHTHVSCRARRDHDFGRRVMQALSSRCTRLTQLRLTSCHDVCADGIASLASLTALTSLALAGCRPVSSPGVCGVLGHLSALTELHLGGCVCDAVVRTALDNLVFIDLRLSIQRIHTQLPSGGSYRAGGRDHTPSRVAPPAGTSVRVPVGRISTVFLPYLLQRNRR
jgi:hypothetical protein